MRVVFDKKQVKGLKPFSFTLIIIFFISHPTVKLCPSIHRLCFSPCKGYLISTVYQQFFVYFIYYFLVVVVIWFLFSFIAIYSFV